MFGMIFYCRVVPHVSKLVHGRGLNITVFHKGTPVLALAPVCHELSDIASPAASPAPAPEVPATAPDQKEEAKGYTEEELEAMIE